MGKKVFVSYCHAQYQWVWNHLVPCLKAGGVELLTDREYFEAGRALVSQMDLIQDRADIHLLVLSADYLQSAHCLHEMKRAIHRDPIFTNGIVIPLQREHCVLPSEISVPNPLYINLVDETNVHAWKQLFIACKADLGAGAPSWLQARDELVRFLGRCESVNLVITGRPRWRELMKHIQEEYFRDLALVNLDRGTTASRPGLIAEILKSLGSPRELAKSPQDLATLDSVISSRGLSRLALLNFDHINHRYNDNDRIDFFSALRFLIMDSRKLVLLAQSRTSFTALLPKTHPLSTIDMKTVELRGEEM